MNSNRKATADTRTPAELLDLIETKGREIADALAVLRRGIAPPLQPPVGCVGSTHAGLRWSAIDQQHLSGTGLRGGVEPQHVRCLYRSGQSE